MGTGVNTSTGCGQYHAGNLFDPSISSSFADAHRSTTLGYGTGPVPVSVGLDAVSLAGASVPYTLGITTSPSQRWLCMPYDGIMGLGLNAQARLADTSWVSAAASAGRWPPMVTLNPIGGPTGAGSLTLGAADAANTTQGFTWLPLAGGPHGPVAWSVGLYHLQRTAVGAGATAAPAADYCTNDCSLDVDTGTSLLLMPAAAFADFSAAVLGGSNGWCTAQGAFLHCSAPLQGGRDALEAALPTLTLVVGGRGQTLFDLPLAPRDLLCCGVDCGFANTSTCLLEVGQGGFGSTGFILGSAVLSRYVSVFDGVDMLVGLAPTPDGSPLSTSKYAYPSPPWYSSPGLWVVVGISIFGGVGATLWCVCRGQAEGEEEGEEEAGEMDEATLAAFLAAQRAGSAEHAEGEDIELLRVYGDSLIEPAVSPQPGGTYADLG